MYYGEKDESDKHDEDKDECRCWSLPGGGEEDTRPDPAAGSGYFIPGLVNSVGDPIFIPPSGFYLHKLFPWSGFGFYVHKLSEDAGPHAGRLFRSKIIDIQRYTKYSKSSDLLIVYGVDVAEDR